MNRPIVGVKFCGGCKEQYDRIKAWNELKESCPEVSFVPVSKGTIYDLVLVISGCFSQCPNVTGLEGRNGFLRVCAEEQFPDAIRKLQALAGDL